MTPQAGWGRVNPHRVRPALRDGLRKVQEASLASPAKRPVPDWIWRELDEIG